MGDDGFQDTRDHYVDYRSNASNDNITPARRQSPQAVMNQSVTLPTFSHRGERIGPTPRDKKTPGMDIEVSTKVARERLPGSENEAAVAKQVDSDTGLAGLKDTSKLNYPELVKERDFSFANNSLRVPGTESEPVYIPDDMQRSALSVRHHDMDLNGSVTLPLLRNPQTSVQAGDVRHGSPISSLSALTGPSKPLAELSMALGSRNATAPTDSSLSDVKTDTIIDAGTGLHADPYHTSSGEPNTTAVTQSLHSTPYTVYVTESPNTSPMPSTQQIRIVHKIRPKSSIPTSLSAREYARQCVAAAESSRLHPYALDKEERIMLRHHLNLAQVTGYLNIRNGILRLWLRRPQVAVTRHEALGCVKDRRWFDAANVCFHWLLRRGYINYGCTKIRAAIPSISPTGLHPMLHRSQKSIVIIGAGMAGLGCARQLDNLFQQYASQFYQLGEEKLPQVVVLEGRNRIGGRIYSRHFKRQRNEQRGTDWHSGLRSTADMGAMIITGFDRGNPLNVLVRGQLGIPYHALWPETTIYDMDGRPVNSQRDRMVEDLFNDCLDRVSEYKFKVRIPTLVEGNRGLMDEGRDSGPRSSNSLDGQRTLAQAEDAALGQDVSQTGLHSRNLERSTPTLTATTTQATIPSKPLLSPRRFSSTDNSAPSPPCRPTAAAKLKLIGWELKSGIDNSKDIDLDEATKATNATLGSVIDEAIRQYQNMVDLSAQDLRMLNWHIANLEYSNATNQACLSLKGWDIDAGNEWEGKHSMVIGGYQSVVRGLMLCPTPLNVQRNRIVTKVRYTMHEVTTRELCGERMEQGAPVIIECEGGHTIEADYVVSTIPLGVLKHGDVVFEPPLPSWKMDAIQRLGFGVLNKIVLAFPRIFWDPERDIFGVLCKAGSADSLAQGDYARQRGHMFQWFNVTATTGLPCLLALMAGDAAYDTETAATDDELVAQAMEVLRSVFGVDHVPDPDEALVTRWASDRFSRGSYSSAGPKMCVDDYDVMARPVGRRLLFAGEHTTGTHPATVHGAYLSGLRVASNIVDELLGPINLPTPFIIQDKVTAPKRKATAATLVDEESGGSGSSGSTVSIGSDTRRRDSRASLWRQQEVRRQNIEAYVESQIGKRPLPPTRVVDTSYLLFSKANYEKARHKCSEVQTSRRRLGSGRAKSNDVRVMTSKMWHNTSAEERRPYIEKAAAQKKQYLSAMEQFTREASAWDQKAVALRATYESRSLEQLEQT